MKKTKLLHDSRKLLFGVLDWTRPKDPPLSLGAASIISTLQNNNLCVESKSMAVNSQNFKEEELIEWALERNSLHHDFAIGCFIWNEQAVQKIIKKLKEKKFKGKIILGGPQVSYTKPETLEKFYPDVDIFIQGYGENSLVEVLKRNEINEGVLYKGEIEKFKTSKVPKLEELTSPFLSGYIKPQKFIRWETQRGCPFKCSFCQHREPNNYNLTRKCFDNSRINSEIEWICSHPIIEDIAVVDPTFNSGENYLNILDSFINYKYQGKISFQCRLEMVNQNFLEKIIQLNQQGARCILEFGIQTIHKNEQKLIDRFNNLKKADSVLHDCLSNGIEFEISLIYGLPNQTLESFIESVEWCLKRVQKKENLKAFPLMLLRGTPIHSRKEELGLIESTTLNEFLFEDEKKFYEGIPHVVSSPSFSKEDWIKMSQFMKNIK
jgi:radical SAM superfamily enzyme YgiQ (UPF0313 family)